MGDDIIAEGNDSSVVEYMGSFVTEESVSYSDEFVDNNDVVEARESTFILNSSTKNDLPECDEMKATAESTCSAYWKSYRERQQRTNS